MDKPPGPEALASAGAEAVAKQPPSRTIEAAPAKGPSSLPLDAGSTRAHDIAPTVEAAAAVAAPMIADPLPPLPPAPPVSVQRSSPGARAVSAAFPASAGAGAAKGGETLAAYEALARAVRLLPDLVSIATRILTEAASSRRSVHAGWDHVARVTAAADDAKLAHADADTPFGNALKVLGSGPDGAAERALACALWAHAVAEARAGDEDRLAGDVLWLATHTAFDATSLLDRALGEEGDVLWAAIGEHIRRIDDGRGTSLGRGEAIVGCAALALSTSASARRHADKLKAALQDPTLLRLLSGPSSAPQRELRLEGEASAAPRGPVVTAILAVTGMLFVIHGARLIARFALAYRRPAELSFSDAGVRMKTRTELLGRTLREREHVIVRSGLVRVVREVRYPRAAFYAGLLALALGSYVGVRAFVDGVRAASPSLLLTGLVVVALGIGADFALGSLIPGVRGRVRIMFVPRAGATLCLADVDAARADDALASALVGPR